MIYLALLKGFHPYINQFCVLFAQSISLSERVEQLSQMSFKRSVIKFNPQKFKDFVKATPRNYSVVIMFTAIAPARQCSICRYCLRQSTRKEIPVLNNLKLSYFYESYVYISKKGFLPSSKNLVSSLQSRSCLS